MTSTAPKLETGAVAESPTAADGPDATRATCWRVWSWRGADLILAATVAAGCAVRIVQWAASRLYSHDEISLLYSIRTIPVGRLLSGPLLLAQGAPLLWLAGQSFVLRVFGDGERTMRAIPLLFACLSVALVGLLARRVLSAVSAVVATALFALAPLAAFYAWQVKPYSADTAVAAGLLLLAVELSGRGWTVRHGLIWWGAAAVAAGLSFPSLFLVGGVSLALVGGRLLGLTAPDGPRDRRSRVAECVRFCVPSGCWFAAAGLVYLLQLRHLDGLQGEYPMWAAGYAPGASLVDHVTWTPSVFAAVVSLVWLTPQTLGALALALAAVGVVSLWRRDRGAWLVIIAPIVVAYLAAVAHAYPLKGRLALWVVPSLVVLMAEPIWPWRGVTGAARRWRQRRWVRVGIAAAGCLLVATVAVPAARSSAYITASPDQYDLALRGQAHSIEKLLEVVRAQQRPGDRFVAQETYFNKATWYGHERGIRVDGVLAVVASAPGC